MKSKKRRLGISFKLLWTKKISRTVPTGNSGIILMFANISSANYMGRGYTIFTTSYNFFKKSVLEQNSLFLNITYTY